MAGDGRPGNPPGERRASSERKSREVPPRPPKDVGEYAERGISPDALLAIATADAVVALAEPKERLTRAAQALDKLRAVVVDVVGDPDQASRAKKLRSVLSGDSGVWTVHAWYLFQDDTLAVLEGARGPRGMGAVVDDVRSRLSARAREQARHLAVEERRLAQEAGSALPLGEAFAGCQDLPKGLRLPPGYDVDDSGVWHLSQGRYGTERKSILQTPAAIVSSPRDIDGHEQHATLVWRRRAADRAVMWDRAQVPLRMLCDGQRLLELVPRGFYTDGTMAKHVARYLMLSVSVNEDLLPSPTCASRCGWLGRVGSDQPLPFLYGQQLVASKRATRPPGGWPTQIALPGLEQLRDALAPRGSAREWCELVRDLAPRYPLALLAMFTAIAAPLLHLVERPGFILQLAGDSTGGKTTALRLAASAVGNPAEGDGLLAGWNTSRVGVEQRAAYLHHLPMFLDETSRCPDVREVARIVLDLCSGHGKVRGAIVGLRALPSWRLPLISTGNMQLATVTSDAGLRARILDLPGAPLGEDRTIAEAVAQRIDLAVARHHGHALRAIVAKLASEPPAYWLAELQRHTALLSPTPIASPVEGRLRAHAATLSLAAELLEHYIRSALKDDGISLDAHRSLELVMACASDAPAKDPASLALALAYEHAAANQQRFWGRHNIDATGEPVQPHQGFVGIWPRGDSWTAIGFLTGPLKTLLAQHGYQLDQCITAWNQRGWLIRGEGQHMKRRWNMNGSKVRAITFGRDVVAKVVGFHQDNDQGG